MNMNIGLILGLLYSFNFVEIQKGRDLKKKKTLVANCYYHKHFDTKRKLEILPMVFISNSNHS